MNRLLGSTRPFWARARRRELASWLSTSTFSRVPTTLTGEVQRVTFENEETSFRVIKLGAVEGLPGRPGPIAVIGTFQAVGPGTRVRVSGGFVSDSRHGEQFRADTLVPLAPGTLAGLEKYLGSGLIPGIGPALAKRIGKWLIVLGLVAIVILMGLCWAVDNLIS